MYRIKAGNFRHGGKLGQKNMNLGFIEYLQIGRYHLLIFKFSEYSIELRTHNASSPIYYHHCFLVMRMAQSALTKKCQILPKVSCLLSLSY